MNRKDRELKRQKAQEVARQKRRIKRNEKRKLYSDTEHIINSLKIEKENRKSGKSVFKQLESAIFRNEKAPIIKRIIREVHSKAPKILASQFFLNGLKNLSHMELINDPEDWVPKGKASQTMFYSLANFLVAKYNIPNFFWTILLEPGSGADNFILFLDGVAKGESPYLLVKRGYLTVSLTRKMCHKLMTTPSKLNFNDSIRHIQFKEFGGNDAVFTAFLGTRYGKISLNIDRPEFIV